MHRMHRITQRAFAQVAAQAPVHLHITDGRLNGAVLMNHLLQGLCDAQLLARAQDSHLFDLYTPIALVHDRRGRPVLG